MTKFLYVFISLIALLVFIQCETPESPDFTLSSKIDAPLLAESNFQFFGGQNALIDTTNSELSDLLQIDGNNFISVSQEQNFEFGDIEDAVPAVEVAPTVFESQVGEIQLSNFSSQNDESSVGEAGFEDLTGQASTLQSGDWIPGAQSPFPVKINLETDYFISAQIKSGHILFTINNELGFDLDNLSMELFSGNQSLGIVDVFNFNHLETVTEAFVLVENPETDPEVDLRDMNVDVEIAWSGQFLQDDPGSLIVRNAEGQNLVASSVDAVIPSQEFRSAGSTSFTDDEFIFTDLAHYVEIESGELIIDDIINSIDVDIEHLEISFPQLRTPPYTEADSLIILFNGNDKIARNTTSPISRSVILDDVRIYAHNNLIDYNIFALTENTQLTDGTDSRIIHESDRLNAEVGLQDLVIREAFGVVRNKQILLNTDIASDGSSAEIMNDLEAEVINIDGIEEISRRIEGIEFTRASLDILYETNVNIPTTIIGAFLGIDANGNEFFLSGRAGTETEVLPEDPTNKLMINGSPIPSENLIKFEVQGSEIPGEVFTNTFNRLNSNITEFFNRLPTSIRFIGLADINRNNETGRISNPVRFDPSLSVNLPLAIRAESATFTDTTAVNLENLPGPDDDSLIEEGALRIGYINNIPLGVNVQLEFLDDTGSILSSLPLLGDSQIQINPASTGTGGFSETPAENHTVITLNRDQINQLNLTRNIRLTAGLSSSDFEEVRVRTTDDVSISVNGNFVIRNKIN